MKMLLTLEHALPDLSYEEVGQAVIRVKEHTANVDVIGVVPRWRKQGHGAALLKLVAQLLSAAGLDYPSDAVTPHSPSFAVRAGLLVYGNSERDQSKGSVWFDGHEAVCPDKHLWFLAGAPCLDRNDYTAMFDIRSSDVPC